MNVPIISDIMKWFGADKVTKEVMLKLMRKDENIAFVPGGFEEATCYQYKKNLVYLKERVGFIKYALQYGYKVVPVYSFGNLVYFTLVNYIM